MFVHIPIYTLIFLKGREQISHTLDDSQPGVDQAKAGAWSSTQVFHVGVRCSRT